MVDVTRGSNSTGNKKQRTHAWETNFLFSVSVGLNGNRTCGITTRIPSIEHLEIHPDYDVYIKKRQGSAWCNVDHLHRDFTLRNKSRNSLNAERPNKKGLVTNVANSFLKSVSMPAILR